MNIQYVEGVLTWFLDYGAIALQPTKVPEHEFSNITWNNGYDPEGLFIVAYMPHTAQQVLKRLSSLVVGIKDGGFVFVQIRLTSDDVITLTRYVLLIAMAGDPELSDGSD